jgi:tetratricopeptide (TPR) repeat protein
MDTIDALKKARWLRNKKGKPAEALRLLEKFASRVQDPYEKILLQAQMAHFALDVGQIRRSKIHFESAISATDLARIDIIRKYVYLLWKLDNKRQAIQMLERAEKDLSRIGRGGPEAHFVAANIYATWGNFWFDSKRYNKALTVYRRALRHAAKCGAYGRQATVWGDIGNVYCAQRAYRKAIVALRRALRLARKYHRHAEPSALLRLGKVYASMQNWRAAKAYFMRSLRVAERGKWKRETGDAHNALGELAFTRSDVKSAKAHFKKALATYRYLGFRWHIRHTEKNLTRLNFA